MIGVKACAEGRQKNTYFELLKQKWWIIVKTVTVERKK